MKKWFLIPFYSIFFPAIVFSMSVVVPTLPLPDNINNITLLTNELPFAVTREVKDLNREVSAAGWQTINCNRFEDMIQGLSINYKTSNFITFSKYGYFASSQEAKEAAEAAIPNKDSFLITKWRPGSFSGSQLGDYCFHWEPSYESARKLAGIHPLYKQALISFTKKKYAFLIGFFSEQGPIDTALLEVVCGKVEKKIEIAVALDELPSSLTAQISNTGILHSLQVKLDHFTESYRQGNYKVALNNINSFINELNAQRGKHVSESAYQTLKSYADTIVQSLNSLM